MPEILTRFLCLIADNQYFPWGGSGGWNLFKQIHPPEQAFTLCLSLRFSLFAYTFQSEIDSCTEWEPLFPFLQQSPVDHFEFPYRWLISQKV